MAAERVMEAEAGAVAEAEELVVLAVEKVEKVEGMGEVLRVWLWAWVLAWVRECERMLQVVVVSLVLWYLL